MRRWAQGLGLAGLILALTGCTKDAMKRQPVSLFVGLDVSGSFYNTRHYPDAVDFLSYYIYGHMHGLGGLHPLKSIYVGSIGGAKKDEPKSFHPIEDFRGKTPAQIREDLHYWFKKSDAITDFNVFFEQVALIAQKRNLALRPIEVLLFTDGVPDLPGGRVGRVEQIDLSPIEFLSRRVTVRLFYPSPTLCSEWENKVPRERVRMWTLDQQVMHGWKAQLKPHRDLADQEDLWKWIEDNVDYRVAGTKFHITTKKK